MNLHRNYKVNGYIESFESKVSKKIGNFDIMNFKLELTFKNMIVAKINYKWMLPI